MMAVDRPMYRPPLQRSIPFHFPIHQEQREPRQRLSWRSDRTFCFYRWKGSKKERMNTKASGMVLLLVLFLSGCLGTASGSQPTVLHVVRPRLVGSQQQVVPPFDHTVSDAAAVQQLYAAALVLPRPSQYPLPCPNDWGLIYQLAFLAGTKQLQQMDVQPLGCQWVYLSQTDVRRANQDFLRLLAHTLGLPSLISAGLLPSS